MSVVNAATCTSVKEANLGDPDQHRPRSHGRPDDEAGGYNQREVDPAASNGNGRNGAAGRTGSRVGQPASTCKPAERTGRAEYRRYRSVGLDGSPRRQPSHHPRSTAAGGVLLWRCIRVDASSSRRWPLSPPTQIISRHSRGAEVLVAPKHGIVQRTYAWLTRCRRHSGQYERETDTGETRLCASTINHLSPWLAGGADSPPDGFADLLRDWA